MREGLRYREWKEGRKKGELGKRQLKSEREEERVK